MKTLIFALAILLAGTAMAQTPMEVGLSWTAPTEYTDGTPIAAGEISGYQLFCGTAPAPTTQTVSMSAGSTSFSRDSLLASGLLLDTPYFCSLTVTTANGETSEKSEEVHFVMASPPPPLVPNAPVLTAQ